MLMVWATSVLPRNGRLPGVGGSREAMANDHVEQTMNSINRAWFNEEVSRLPLHGLHQEYGLGEQRKSPHFTITYCLRVAKISDKIPKAWSA